MAWVVHKRFGYDQAHVSCLRRGPSIVATSTIDREFVRGLEQELIKLAGARSDNKTVFIFSDSRQPWMMNAVSFYDMDATFIRWQYNHWGTRTPANITIGGKRATSEDLNLPPIDP